MVNQEGLNAQNYVNDILLRAGITDPRKQAEMTRKGLSDLGSFQQDFKQQTEQATAPETYLGAGRRLYNDQTPDQRLIDLKYLQEYDNPDSKSGKSWYTYNPKDWMFGDTTNWDDPNSPLTKKYRSGGIWDVYDRGGNDISDYYSDPTNAIREIGYDRAVKGIQYQDFTPGTAAVLQQNEYNPSSWEIIQAATPDTPAGYYSAGQYAETEEALKQLLWDKRNQLFSSSSGNEQMLYHQLGRMLDGAGLINPNHRMKGPGNSKVTGLETLYGSQPLFEVDPETGLGSTKYYNLGDLNVEPWEMVDMAGRTRSAARGWREYTDKDKWGQLVSKMGDDYYVKPEDADELPGWENKNTYWYHKEKKKKGGLGGILGSIGSILSFVPGPWQLPAQIFSGINAIANKNPIGAVLSFANAGGFGLGDLFGGGDAFAAADAAQLAGQGIGTPQIADIMNQTYGLGDIASNITANLGSLSGMTGIPANALVKAGTGFGTALLSGKGNPLTKGGIAGLASIFGGQVGNELGPLAGRIAEGAGSFGLGALANRMGQAKGQSSIEQAMQLPALQAGATTQTQQREEEPQLTPRQMARLAYAHRNGMV
jgi:hypothetical protein